MEAQRAIRGGGQLCLARGELPQPRLPLVRCAARAKPKYSSK